VEDEDGQLPQEAPLQTPYLAASPKIPAEKSEVLQHIELLFALSIKVPEMLEECVFILLSSRLTIEHLL
jgi:symplekin